MSSWKRQSISDIEAEKEIITGIITNTQYLKEIQQIYSPDVFQISYSKIIVSWCFDYYKKYNEAPDSNIQELYNAYSNSKNADEAQVELMGKFLSDLSEKHENTNIEYHINKAERYIRKRKIEILRENLGLLLIEDKIDESEKEIGDYKRPARQSTTGVDIIHGSINKSLNEEDEVLFQFPGDLGKMISPFCREDFVAVAAPMKRGKTLWLEEIGLKGMFRGFKVIFYSFESSEYRMIKRIYQNLLGETNTRKEIEYPYFDEDNNIEYKNILKNGISQRIINRKKKQLEKMLHTGFWLACFPTYSMSVEDIKIHLDNLDHYNNFIPDIIIIDYADILAPEKNSSKEERHKLNNTWLALRGLAQERKALVVTGTQLTRATFNRDATQEDVAEDIRKLAHVTHMVALNQNKEDKKKSIMRINMLAVRDEEFHVGDEIVVLECKQIGKPFLDARWKKDVGNLEKN